MQTLAQSPTLELQKANAVPIFIYKEAGDRKDLLSATSEGHGPLLGTDHSVGVWSII